MTKIDNTKGLTGRLTDGVEVEAWQVPSPWPTPIDPAFTWMPMWVRDAFANGTLAKWAMTNYVQVTSTGSKAMPGDWIVRLQSSQRVFIVLTASEFPTKFIATETATPMLPESQRPPMTIDKLVRHSEGMYEACMTVNYSIVNGDGFARELYRTLHLIYGEKQK